MKQHPSSLAARSRSWLVIVLALLLLGSLAGTVGAQQGKSQPVAPQQAPDEPQAPLAGPIGSYGFTNTTTPYATLTGATTFTANGGSGTLDDGYSALLTIPFSFEFGPNTYNQYRVTTNGWIQLGTATPSVGSGTYPALSSSNTNLIAFVANDLNNTGAVYSYVTEGAAPNRIHKIQAANFYEYNTTSHTGNAQVWLYETTNVVEIHYGTFATNWDSGNTVQVGLKGASTATSDVRALSGTGATTWTAPTANNSSTATMQLAGTVVPDSGRTYTFTPPAPAPNLTTSTKSASTNAARTGDTIAYTIVINNGGTAAATNVTLSDPIPTGTTYVAGSVATVGGPPNATYNSGTNAIEWSSASLAAGASVTITFSVTVTATSGTITNTATINASNIAAPVTKQAVTTVFVGSGTDSTYSYKDSLTAGGPTPNFLDATGGTLLMGSSTAGTFDDAEANVTMPFSITYYSLLTNNLRVANNGGILLGATTGEVSASNTAMASAPTNFVAPFWDDIDDDTGGVYVQTFGTAPNRIFVVEWFNRPRFDNIGAATFEVQFHERSNNIRFEYLDVDFGNATYNNGADATVGIRGNTIQYSFNQAVLQPNLAILFDHIPTAATLANFAATDADTHVQVAWETALETDNLGFNLLRATSAEGERTQLNAALIPSTATGGQGAAYGWPDHTVVPNTTYLYWLETVDTQGQRALHGPASVEFQPATAVTLANVGARDATGPMLPLALGLLTLAGLVAAKRRRN